MKVPAATAVRLPDPSIEPTAGLLEDQVPLPKPTYTAVVPTQIVEAPAIGAGFGLTVTACTTKHPVPDAV